MHNFMSCAIVIKIIRTLLSKGASRGYHFRSQNADTFITHLIYYDKIIEFSYTIKENKF